MKMKTIRPNISVGQSLPFRATVATLALLGAAVYGAQGQDISKANNANPMNSGASWLGGVAPGTANIALWDTNVNVTTAPSYPLGGNLSWAGMAIGAYGQFTNSFFNPNTGSSSLINITNNGLNTLTLGTSGLDLSLSTNNLTITNINLALNGNQTWNFFNGRTVIVGGNISGTGNLTKEGNGVLTLDGTNGFNGNLVIGGGLVNLNFSSPNAPTNNILNPSQPLVFDDNGGAIAINGKAGTTNTQAFNGVQPLTGLALITSVPGGSGGSNYVSLGALTRATGGGAINFGPLYASAPINTTSTNDATGILGPWACISSSTTAGGGGGISFATNWACVDINGNITNYTGWTLLTGAGPTIANNPTSNVRVDNGSTGNIEIGPNPTTTINTIIVNGGTARTLDIQSGSTLRLGANGGILKASGSGSSLLIGASTGTGTLTAGGADNTPGELMINDQNGNNNRGSGTLTLNSVVADNGTGPVTLSFIGGDQVLINSTCTHSGGTYIIGRVQLNNSTARLGTGPIYVKGLPLAAFIQQGFQQIGNYAVGGTYYMNGQTITNNLYLEGCGNVDAAQGVLRNVGNLYGTINLMKDSVLPQGNYYANITGTGNLYLRYQNNSANFYGTNNYLGNTILMQISLQDHPQGNLAGNPGSLPPTTVVVMGQGTGINGTTGNILGNTLLKLYANQVIAGLADGTFMCPPPYYRSVDVNSGAVTLTLSNNTQNLYYSGTISNSAGTLNLVKDGSYTQTLAGTNAFNGTVQIQNGLLVMGNPSAIGTGPVNLIGGGALSFGALTAVSFGALEGTNNLALTNASGAAVALSVGNNDGQTYTMSGVLSGGGSLTKNGNDYEYLDAADTYTGLSVINAGTLYLTANGSISNSPQILVGGGATFDASAAGGLTLNGAARQILGGSGIVNGTVTAVSGSTLSPGSAVGTLTLNNDLNLNGGVTNLFDLSGDPTGVSNPNDEMVVFGNLNLSGVNPVIINPYLLTLGNGEYPLIQYANLASGGVANLQLQLIGGYTMYLTNDPAISAIAVVIIPSHSPASITWRGNGLNNNWDLVTADWINGGLVTFFNGDSVTFDDTGSNNIPVNLIGAVGPAAVEVNITKNYTFAGSGEISGVTALNKDGNGTLTLLTGNTYLGGTTINAGTVHVGNGGTNGAIGSGNIADNGALILDRSGLLSFTNTLSGIGSLTLQGGGTFSFTGDASGFSGPVTINSASASVPDFANLGTSDNLTLNGGTLVLSTGDAESPTWNIALGGSGGTINHVNALTLGDGANYPITGNGSFTKAGSGTMTLMTSNNYSGTTIVAGGVLKVDTGGTTAWIPNGLALKGGSLINQRSDSYYQNGYVSGTGGGSITINFLGAGNTNYMDFVDGNNSFYNIANTSAAGTLILDGSTNSINTLGGSLSSSANAVLDLQGGIWNLSSAFAPGGAELDFNGGFVVVMNNGGNGLQSFNVPTLVINSGGLILGAGARFSNGADNQSLTLNGGVLMATNTTYGFRFANNQGGGNQANLSGYYGFSGVQTGGLVYAPGLGEQRLSIGGSGPVTAGDNASWTMTGGQIVITNSAPNGGSIYLGADTAGVGTTTFSLGGTGQLLVYSIAGAQAGANQIFNWTGGTNTAFAINMSNLQSTNTPGLAGTLYNNGGALVPGGFGSAGVTTITGNYDIAAGGAVLDMDVGGLAHAGTFNGATNASDYVQVTQSAVLGGSLHVHLLNGFEPLAPAGQSIVILTATNITGTFTNLDGNGRLTIVGDSTRSFHVTITATNVVLDGYQTPTVQAYFTQSTAAGATPLTVTFTNLSNGAGLTNLWSFGDGASLASTASTVSHTYSSIGTNTVSLTAGSTAGVNIYTVSNAVVVTAPTGPTGPAHLTNSVTGNILTLSWPGGLNWRLVAQTNPLSTGLLSATNDWFTVAGSAGTNSASITIDPTQGAVFYRLVYP